MNEIQKGAYVEGFNQIAGAFQSKKNLDVPTLTHWVNGCMARDSSAERSVQLIDRDGEGDISKTTTLHGGRSEMCGYRLLGAFEAVESIRAALQKSGVTLNVKAQHE